MKGNIVCLYKNDGYIMIREVETNNSYIITEFALNYITLPSIDCISLHTMLINEFALNIFEIHNSYYHNNCLYLGVIDIEQLKLSVSNGNYILNIDKVSGIITLKSQKIIVNNKLNLILQ